MRDDPLFYESGGDAKFLRIITLRLSSKTHKPFLFAEKNVFVQPKRYLGGPAKNMFMYKENLERRKNSKYKPPPFIPFLSFHGRKLDRVCRDGKIGADV